MNIDIVDALTRGPRMSGQTTSNIALLLMNPKAKLVVHIYNMKRSLSRQYNLPENRFITVDELDRGMGAMVDGPLFFDAPAVAEIAYRAYSNGLAKIVKTPVAPVNKNVYQETKDFMQTVLEYSKKHNVAVTFTPL